MGLIQRQRISYPLSQRHTFHVGHKIDKFTYENILSDTTWLSNSDWIYTISGNGKGYKEGIIVLNIDINVSVSHIHIKLR